MYQNVESVEKGLQDHFIFYFEMFNGYDYKLELL